MWNGICTCCCGCGSCIWSTFGGAGSGLDAHTSSGVAVVDGVGSGVFLGSAVAGPGVAVSMITESLEAGLASPFPPQPVTSSVIVNATSAAPMDMRDGFGFKLSIASV